MYNNSISEFIAYTTYIYSIILFSIYIKPTLVILLIIVIYCALSTWILIKECDNKLLYNNRLLYGFIFMYSILCTLFYYLIHITWNSYKHNTYYILSLIVAPIFYYYFIKYSEVLFGCGKNYITKRVYAIL
jgi:hypothetical protein